MRVRTLEMSGMPVHYHQIRLFGEHAHGFELFPGLFCRFAFIFYACN